jgi:hypothetical protein
MTHTANTTRLLSGVASAALFLSAGFAPAPSVADEELDEFFVRIEINASDGDVGGHIKLDGEGWGEMTVTDPRPMDIYVLDAQGILQDQGQTENFSESTEPLCYNPLHDDDPENDDEEWQTLADFLLQFIEGNYTASGMTIGGDAIEGEYTLVHEIPGAPNISRTDGRHFEIDDDDDFVVIRWRKGDDFGECSTDPETGAYDGGLVPANKVELWEITVEPDVDDDVLEDANLLKTVFTVQLAGNQRRKVTVPNEYFRKYLRKRITDFKFEIGARIHENQTFSEGGFTIGYDD